MAEVLFLLPGWSVCVCVCVYVCVCVWEKARKKKGRESEIECPVQRACIINEITLADGSYLGSVPQPPRFAAGSHTHTCFFLSLVKCAPDSLSLPFLALFTLCPSLTLSLSLIPPFSLYPPLCARLLFIERFGQRVQAFRPKNSCHAPTPTPP